MSEWTVTTNATSKCTLTIMSLERIRQTKDAYIVDFGFYKGRLVQRMLHTHTELGGSVKSKQENNSFQKKMQLQAYHNRQLSVTYLVLCVQDSITPVSVRSDSRW